MYNKTINIEIFYYTGYNLQIYLNQFEKLLNEYEHGINKDCIEDEAYFFINEKNEPERFINKNKTLETPTNKYNIDVLYNLIRITNNYLNSSSSIIKHLIKY